jgi:hypothetical protein
MAHEQEEKIFADGFSFKRNEKAPEFVIGRISIKVDDAKAFLDKHQKNGWVNINAKYARSGNAYMELDTFEAKSTAPVQKEEPKVKSAPKKKDEVEDELPF